MSKPYNPQVGEIWWFETVRKHCLILSKEEPSEGYKFYQWTYNFLQLENGTRGSIYHGTMNAHGEGWFRKVA